MPNGNNVKVAKCPRATRCPFYQQFETPAKLQIVTHAHLMAARQLAFTTNRERDQVDILVIDESLLATAVGEKDAVWSLDELRTCLAPHEWQGNYLAPTGPSPADVAAFWADFADAQPSTEGRSMHERQRFVARDIEHVATYHREQLDALRQVSFDEYDASAVEAIAKQVGPLLAEHRRRLSLLFIIRDGYDGRAWIQNGRLHMAQLRKVNNTWTERAYILMLDATAPPWWAIEQIVGRVPNEPEEIAVEWASEIQVVQVIEAPVSKTKVLKPEAEVHNLANLIAAGYSSSLYVPRASVIEALGDKFMGSGIHVVSPGVLVGINRYEETPLAVVSASGDPGVLELERMVGILTGYLPRMLPCPPQRNGGWDRPYANPEEHPDPRVVEIRQTLVDATIVQVAARLRPIRRAGKPGLIVIFSDAHLSLPVTSTVDWNDVTLSHAADWFMDGSGCFTNAKAQAKHLGRERDPRGIEHVYDRGVRGALNSIVSGTHPLIAVFGVVRYRVSKGRKERAFIWIGSIDQPEEIVRRVEGRIEIIEVCRFTPTAPLAPHRSQYNLYEANGVLTQAPARIHAGTSEAFATMREEGFVPCNPEHIVQRFGVTRSAARELAKKAKELGWIQFHYRKSGSKGRPSCGFARSADEAKNVSLNYLPHCKIEEADKTRS